jgi:DNA-binding NtrC family response regulator
MAQRVASADCTVLMMGETGSGKGYAARWIYDHSRRGREGRPFVPVNCGAIPDGLIDSHLFGHARGAFSGAEKEHPGLVRAAEGGTLLLDEIAELPASAQTRLLRLLEEREVQPVGYARPVQVDVRIIAATSADLFQRVADGAFRQDLLFRLDIVRLSLPPLRQRRDEIFGLLEQFNAEFARLYGQPELAFDAGAMRMIQAHDWPGNVRELRTLVERLHVLCGRDTRLSLDAGDDHDQRVITITDLIEFGHMRRNDARPGTPTATLLHQLKHDTVNQALNACAGNMGQAAATLGVHRSTLYRWLASQRRIPA